MQLPWNEHFFEIVIPAWQGYLLAEKRLSAAIIKQESDPVRCGYDALREGGAAAIWVHHFAEIVLRARPVWLPKDIQTPKEIYEWLSAFCTYLRTERPANDVRLLWNVADALKHAVLTRTPPEHLHISGNEAVLVLSNVYGSGNFGEGKYGGVLEVTILTNDGRRALSGVLQNVIDAWRIAARLPMPPINMP